MPLNKEAIISVLSKMVLPNQSKSVIDQGLVTNIQVFEDSVDLDFLVSNPTLQYKKMIEEKCSAIFREEMSAEINLRINFIIEDSKKQVEIKGDPIPNVKNIIAVSSAKGGVGKSTIAANLAVALAELEYKVGVIDADIYGPSMHIMFGIDSEKPKAVNADNKSKMEPITSYGVKVASIGFFVQNQEAIVWRGPMASKALNQLLWDTHWGDLDYLIVDLPPGTGDIHLSLVQSIPLSGAIVVSTPQSIALADAEKGINMFQKESINVPVLGVIENMSYFIPSELPEKKYFIFGKDGAKGLAEKMNISLLAEIPIEQSIREAADAGRPAVLQQKTFVSKNFLELAQKTVAIVQKRNINLPQTKKVEITHNKGCST